MPSKNFQRKQARFERRTNELERAQCLARSVLSRIDGSRDAIECRRNERLAVQDLESAREFSGVDVRSVAQRKLEQAAFGCVDGTKKERERASASLRSDAAALLDLQRRALRV